MTTAPANSKERILHSALELFSEKGFSGTSVQEIATKAHVSKALVHYIFTTKEAILMELLTDFKEDLAGAFTRIYTKADCDRYYGCWDTDEIQQGLDFFIENRQLWIVLVLESLKSTSGKENLIDVWGELNVRTRNKMLTDRGFTLEGDLTKDIVDFFFIFVPTMMFAVFKDDWTALQGGSSEEEIAESFTDILNTLYAAFLRENTRAELLKHMIAAQEEERKRIARELHDETSQALTALMLALDTAGLALEAGHDDVPERLASARAIADNLLEDVQRLVTDLRPSMLDDLGLVAAIAWYGEQRLEPVGVELRLEGDGLECRLPAPVETALFRIVQEALTNVVRYAGAQTVAVRLDVGEKELVLKIADDGCGIDPKRLESKAFRSASLGLRGMQERVGILDGEFTLETAVGKGVAITVRIPVSWIVVPE